jgi:DUF1009 family protein
MSTVDHRGVQAAATADRSSLAIICGGGSLPYAVAQAAVEQGRRVVLIALRGVADAARVARHPHHWIGIAQFGRCVRLARTEGCRDLVFIGSVVRPTLAEIRPDWGVLRLLPNLLKLFRGGDDGVLSVIVKAFEHEGFRVLGAHEIAPNILVPPGQLGKHGPTDRDEADIARGLAFIEAAGPFDVGQAVVVADQRVLAVEAAEGTDEMLERLAALRDKGRVRSRQGVGVLIKAPKPGQDMRVDLPSIGPQTVERAERAGLAGIAVAAGAAVIAEPQDVSALADRKGLFVVGVTRAAQPQ